MTKIFDKNTTYPSTLDTLIAEALADERIDAPISRVTQLIYYAYDGNEGNEYGSLKYKAQSSLGVVKPRTHSNSVLSQVCTSLFFLFGVGSKFKRGEKSPEQYRREV